MRRLKSGEVEIASESENWSYDHVILATHADTSLALLGKDAKTIEEDILSRFVFSQNEAVLHYDETVRQQMLHLDIELTFAAYANEERRMD